VNTQPGLTTVEVVCLDEKAAGFATFQSHNQKVVSNRNGIFTTHLRTRNEAYTAQQWRLSRSADGGKSFVTVYEATDATNPPVIETDEDDNLYVARPDFVDGDAYLYRFLAADGYARPLVSRIPKGSAGKYSMAYDPGRRQLYYFAHNRTFHVLGLDGIRLGGLSLLALGRDAVPEYPLLCLDRDGTLHAAWTTFSTRVRVYWDIHYIQSRDGGRTWQRMDGTPLTPPVVGDQNGPADRITLDDEFEASTWLSSFLAKDGKLHFLYLAATKPARQHYVRYDAQSARRDLDVYPQFKGRAISLGHLDGFFATKASLPGSPLYCIALWNRRIACLASDDNGETWYDYAASDRQFEVAYSIGGCRELTADGCIIGSFTDRPATGDGGRLTCPAQFIRIQAGLSRAEVAEVRREKGHTTLAFREVRGQPQQIRFQRADGAWGNWEPFKPTMALPTDAPPASFQLKSRLGVVSPTYPIKDGSP